MGWLTSSSWRTRRQVITHLVKPYFVTGEHRQTKQVCLAHCIRGGTLWVVWEYTTIDLETSDFEQGRIIACYLIRSYGEHEGHGYKDMDEGMGPNYYDCPLKYLEMQPIALNKWSAEWREKVKAYHAKRNTKIAEGMYVGLQNSTIKALRILRRHMNGRDWVGEDRQGNLFRVRRKDLSGETFINWPEVA